jgi:hypothetical protein
VNISKQSVTVFLDEDGRAILAGAAISIPSDSRGIVVNVAETDDLGIWIRINRQDANHLLLIRWEYVLSVDLPDRRQPMAGIAGKGI